MKKFPQPIFLILITFLAFNITGCKKAINGNSDSKNAAIHKIVLLVDTENIPDSGSFDINKYCSFSDQPSNTSVEDYLKQVAPGDSIIWYGVSSSDPENHKVLIHQINYKGGVNLLGQNVINGKKGVVRGQIIDNGKAKDEEKYELKFRVVKEGFPPKIYPIDPKLRI